MQGDTFDAPADNDDSQRDKVAACWFGELWVTWFKRLFPWIVRYSHSAVINELLSAMRHVLVWTDQSCWCGEGHKFGDPVDEIDLACHNYFR